MQMMASLKDEIIIFDNRFQGHDGSNHCLMSIDCFDCVVFEHWPFDTSWHSQKFNGLAIKCELGVCIKSGQIVWLNGPFKAGKQDAQIAMDKLCNIVANDEGLEVDGGCTGHVKFKAPATAIRAKT